MKYLKPLEISFEFFPPKTAEGKNTLQQSALALTALNPNFFSMTFGAGGSTRLGTLEAVKDLQSLTNTAVAPHLSCLGFSREELVEALLEYKSMGLKRLVALRGDLPNGAVATGEFKLAVDLVSLIRDVTGDHFHIEIAAYPEVHPQALNATADLVNLKLKYAAGADSAITQYFFNPDAYFYFLDACAKQHIHIPVVPGIMPIVNFQKLVNFSAQCGADIPRWLYKRLEAYGDDAEAVKEFGLEVVHNLCQQLLSGGAPGLHFYTLNQAELSMRIVKELHLDNEKAVAKQELVGV